MECHCTLSYHLPLFSQKPFRVNVKIIRENKYFFSNSRVIAYSQIVGDMLLKAVVFLIEYGHKDLEWLLKPGYDPDRNLLSMCSRTILVWVVDFVMAGGSLKAIVCFDCVSIAFQQWWWGLGQAAFIAAATNNLSSHSLAVALHSGLLSTPAFPALVVVLSKDARNCVQMDEQNAGRLKISYNAMSQRILWRIRVDLLDMISSRHAGFRKEVTPNIRFWF